MKIKKVNTSILVNRRHIQIMHKECFPQLPLYRELHGDWWIAYDPEPVAFCGLHASVRTEGAGYLCRGGVLPKARGKGLQKRMIKLRERAAKAKGWTVLLSDTDPLNAYSMNNLINCGFRAFRPKVLWATNHDVWCYWRKAISVGMA